MTPRQRAPLLQMPVLEEQALCKHSPITAPALCVLGLIDAALGRKEDALREGRRAIELLPVTKDSMNGAHMIEFFAIMRLGR